MHESTTQQTRQRIENIQKVWKPDMSAREIAAKLSEIEGQEVNRRMVIGIYHRNRSILMHCPLLTKQASAIKSGLTRTKKARTVKPVARKPNAPRSRVALPPAPLPPEPARPQYSAGHETKLTEQLERNDCRFPVEGNGEHLRYCAQDRREGSPYCAHHHKIAYRPWDGKGKPKVPSWRNM